MDIHQSLNTAVFGKDQSGDDLFTSVLSGCMGDDDFFKSNALAATGKKKTTCLSKHMKYSKRF